MSVLLRCRSISNGRMLCGRLAGEYNSRGQTGCDPQSAGLLCQDIARTGWRQANSSGLRGAEFDIQMAYGRSAEEAGDRITSLPESTVVAAGCPLIVTLAAGFSAGCDNLMHNRCGSWLR